MPRPEKGNLKCLYNFGQLIKKLRLSIETYRLNGYQISNKVVLFFILRGQLNKIDSDFFNQNS